MRLKKPLLKLIRPVIGYLRFMAKKSGIVWDMYLLGWVLVIVSWITDFTMQPPYGGIFALLAMVCFIPGLIAAIRDMRRLQREIRRLDAEIAEKIAKMEALLKAVPRPKIVHKPKKGELQEL